MLWVTEVSIFFKCHVLRKKNVNFTFLILQSEYKLSMQNNWVGL